MRALLDYLLYVCAFCVIGVGALGAWDALTNQPSSLTPDTAQTARENLTVLPEPFPGRGIITTLIIGADERPEYNDRGRSDTIILFFVNPRTKQAALLSVPRDLRVHIPGHGTNKINAAFAFGGVELVQQTVEELLDIDIDYYAKANFQGFVEIVDMLGGVDIEVPDVEGRGRGMNYDDNRGNLHIHLKPGFQHLNGEQAIGFVRYRKGDSDFKRSERQHQFIKAMAEQKLKITRLPQLIRIAPKVLEAIETNMSWREAVDMARVVREIRPDNLLSASFQPYLRDIKIGGIYYVEISDSNIARVLSEIRQHLRSLPGQFNLVEVLNGCGKSGAAGTAGLALEDAGFELYDTGNADSFDYKRTLIYYPRRGLSSARRAQRILGVGELVEIGEDSPFSLDRITIIVGADFDPEALTQTAGR